MCQGARTALQAEEAEALQKQGSIVGASHFW